MIWKKHGERLIGENIVLIMTDSRNRDDKLLTERVTLYEGRGYKVNVKYHEGSYESNSKRTRKDFKKNR